jgi:tetratricopeptide (TPR) repeat protein
MIEKIVDLVGNLTPIALIGPGGIGKTSIALTVLHHDRIKKRFGEERRFIRCDQFPPSRAHLLRKVSKVIGAGIENPEDLTPLRAFLSSKKMLIVLDNAESILDPRGTDAEGIYAVVDELSRFSNICICITSRITITPPDCKHLDVPTLSVDAARDTFYRIYDSDDRSDLVNGILEQLDFHPLSITLLATVARQNRWDMERLAREWEGRRTSVLQTENNVSLAATIELSLASPLFQELGPDARALLGVVAFFPQGVDENNLEWLFPTIPNRTDIFNRFCILSLTYRSNGFVTMLAPLRDHLCPKDPTSSPLLCTTKAHYIARISVILNPNQPDFVKTQWITSEDLNVEHLLDVFTTIDPNSDGIWRTCTYFMRHLNWHKNRLIILKPKIEGLPDDHSSKPECLFELSRLFGTVGNGVERKRLLTCALKLSRERGDGHQIARTLRHLANTNGLMDLPKEGIQLAREALEVGERLGDTVVQARCLTELAWLLCDDKQLDAAEDAASRAIGLFPEKGEEYRVCGCNRVLGWIYQSKRERGKALHHFEVAFGIASSFGWHMEQFWVHYRLAGLFYEEGRLDDAHTHIKRAKSHTANSARNLALATEMRARVWCEQERLDEARSEALRAADAFEKLGATEDLERCGRLLKRMRRETDTAAASGQLDFNCELLYMWRCFLRVLTLHSKLRGKNDGVGITCVEPSKCILPKVGASSLHSPFSCIL